MGSRDKNEVAHELVFAPFYIYVSGGNDCDVSGARNVIENRQRKVV